MWNPSEMVRQHNDAADGDQRAGDASDGEVGIDPVYWDNFVVGGRTG